MNHEMRTRMMKWMELILIHCLWNLANFYIKRFFTISRTNSKTLRIMLCLRETVRRKKIKKRILMTPLTQKVIAPKLVRHSPYLSDQFLQKWRQVCYSRRQTLKIRKRISIFDNKRLELSKLQVSHNIMKSWLEIVMFNVVLTKDRQKWIQNLPTVNNKQRFQRSTICLTKSHFVKLFPG